MCARVADPVTVLAIVAILFQPLLAAPLTPKLPVVSAELPLAVHRYVAEQYVSQHAGNLPALMWNEEVDLPNQILRFNEQMLAEMPQWLRNTPAMRSRKWFDLAATPNPYDQAIEKIVPILRTMEEDALQSAGFTEKQKQHIKQQILSDVFAAKPPTGQSLPQYMSTVDYIKLRANGDYSRQHVVANKVILGLTAYLSELGFRAIEDEIVDRIRVAVFGSEIAEIHELVKEIHKDVKQGFIQQGQATVALAETRAAAYTNLMLSMNAEMQLRRILEHQARAASSLADVNRSLDGLKRQQSAFGDKVDVVSKSLTEANESLHRIEAITKANHALFRQTANGVNVLFREKFLDSGSRSQLRMLQENPDLLTVAPEKRAALETRLKIDVATQDVQDFMEDANQVLGALAELGLDPQITKIASDAIKAGSALNAAAGKIANGDFVSAAIGLIGALFGGGPSIAEQRHKEVMAKLREIERTARQTYVQTLHIRQDIANLSAKIDRNHRDIIDRLDVLEQLLIDVMDNTDQALQIAVGYRQTRQFLANEKQSRPKTLGEMVDSIRKEDQVHARMKVYRAAEGLKFLGGTVGGRDRFMAPLHFASNTKHPKYQSTLGAWKHIRDLVKQDSWNNCLWAIHAPALSVRNLDARNGETVPESNIRAKQFDELLSPQRVVEYSETALMVSAACYFIAPTENAADLQFVDVASGEPHPRMAEMADDLLQQSIALVDVALAQQSLLQGDATVALIAARLNNPDLRDRVAKLEAEKRQLDIDGEKLRSFLEARRTLESLETLYGKEQAQEMLDEEYRRALDEMNARIQAGNLRDRFDRFMQEQRQLEEQMLIKDNPVLAHNLLIHLLRSERLIRKVPNSQVGRFSYRYFLDSPTPWYLQNSLNHVANPPRVIEIASQGRQAVFPCGTVVAFPDPETIVDGSFVLSDDFKRLLDARLRLEEAAALQRIKRSVGQEGIEILNFIITHDQKFKCHASRFQGELDLGQNGEGLFDPSWMPATKHGTYCDCTKGE